jgi:Domain of Unknown Function (DUF1080)
MQAKTFFSLALCFAAQCIFMPANAQTLPPKYSSVVSDSEWANDFKATALGGAGFNLVTFGLSDVKYDVNYWTVATLPNGANAIIGDTKGQKIADSTFFQLAQPVKSFELKFSYKFDTTAGNGGVQYRAVNNPIKGPYALKGYQADLDVAHTYTGQNYEDQAAGTLANRGEVFRIYGINRNIENDPKDDKVLGNRLSYFNTFARDPQTNQVVVDELKQHLQEWGASHDGWHKYHIIARGAVMIHIVDDKVMSILIDDNPERIVSGMLGFQLHESKVMKVQYADIRIKAL